jgi:hypothetical protein
VWQGWRVRFPASEVMFDFFFSLLFLVGRLEVGDGRWDVGGVAVGGSGWQWVWQGWRVRFPASDVMFDVFFSLLFLFGFLVVICFASVCFSFSFLWLSFLLMHHIAISSYFHIFKINRASILCVASGQCFIEQQCV